jgi:hypothetical protein
MEIILNANYPGIATVTGISGDATGRDGGGKLE